MKTILEIISLSTDYLKKHQIPHARRQAEELVCDALGMQRLQLYLEFDRPLTNPELVLCRSYLERRGKGEPLPYIHGTVEFLDCRIQVNPSVLIPRQETEILTDKIIQKLSKVDHENKILWDVCCGSGCIGIAIKKKLPDLRVVLSDYSEEALSIAKNNAESNDADVEIVQGDLLTPFQGQHAHFFVCNPPYIAENEFLSLDKEVSQHEPYQALIAGRTGLEFYERLAVHLPGHMLPGGRIWLEMGKGQGEPIKKLFSSFPGSHCWVELDWAGHDRFFFLEME